MNKKFLKFIYRNLRDAYLTYQFPREGGYSYFRGVFESFEQAIASAPKSKSIGYNNAALAEEYCNSKTQLETIQDYDYPMLFWLQSIFNEKKSDNISILDFGGNVGIHFYAYQKYIYYPENLKWLVLDVPEIVKSGKNLSQANPSSKLDFTESIEHISGKNVFMASGSIQYSIEDLSVLLKPLLKKPKHLLLNRIPLGETEQFVTLQNGGKVFYAQYVFNRFNFIKSLQEIGYDLIDLWEDKLDRCIIPFYPQKSIQFYHGMYLKLRDDTL
jgi:putative methyltransferase (TIGR04325 family)